METGRDVVNPRIAEKLLEHFLEDVKDMDREVSNATSVARLLEECLRKFSPTKFTELAVRSPDGYYPEQLRTFPKLAAYRMIGIVLVGFMRGFSLAEYIADLDIDKLERSLSYLDSKMPTGIKESDKAVFKNTVDEFREVLIDLLEKDRPEKAES